MKSRIPGSSSTDTSTTNSDSSYFPRVLPIALLERVAAFLLGSELFALSHTSSDALQVFSRDHLWSPRLGAFAVDSPQDSSPDATTTDLHAVSSKQRYIRECRSFLFPGRAREDSTGDSAGAGIPVRRLMRDAFGSWGNPFSFETWFSLSQPGEGSTNSLCNGGVLLGAQSVRLVAVPNESLRPDSFAHMVYVDAQCNLFCSAVKAFDLDVPVAFALEPGRWYHLALVYADRRECVYLDGALLQTEIGKLPAKWRSLYAAQVGTGFVSAHSIGSPAQGGRWHEFRGVVDSFRVYRFSLSSDTIQQLSRGSSIDDERGAFDVASFCLQRDAGAGSSVQRVRCSRPRERWCRVIPNPIQDTDALDDLVDGI